MANMFQTYCAVFTNWLHEREEHHHKMHVRSSPNARTFIAQRTYVHWTLHVRAFLYIVYEKVALSVV